MNWKPISAALLTLLLGSSACNKGSTKPVGPTPTSADAQVVVALIGGQPLTMADLDKAAGRELFEIREKTLDNLVGERVVKAAAQKAGQSDEDFLRKQVETKVPQVSVEEAKSFFEANKERLPPQLAGQQFDAVKDTIVTGLTNQKRREAIATTIEELKKKAGVQILLRAPKIQVATEGPSKGPKEAKVTVVEFSDFQCPYCSKGRAVMDQVVAKYGNKVRLVFRDFPLDFHEKAQKAAEAGQCANDQGKFWAMHDWMFDNQQNLDVDSLKNAAKTLGIDSAKFDNCLTSGQHAALVKKNIREGQEAGVRGTPAFFVNGTFLSGALPLDKFSAEIDRALAE
ncbi:MAG TPA: thioredoxin domain-containing protein [Pseudomonadota bacterium]|nr:thioredoxin domain-containing protein [Pseudomonadota bacterium]